MYCRCGSGSEMKRLQEQQQWQGVGETVYYYHCAACGRNHLPKNERKKLEQSDELL